MDQKTLFAGQYLPDMLRHQKERLKAAALDIGSVTTNLSEDQIVKKLVHEFKVEPPTLHEDRVQKSLEDGVADLRGTFQGLLNDVESPETAVKVAVYAVPFSGEEVFFEFRPSTYSSAPPRAEVDGQVLRFCYPAVGQSPEDIKTTFERDLAKVKESLAVQYADVAPYSADLENFIRETLKQAKGSRKAQDDFLDRL